MHQLPLLFHEGQYPRLHLVKLMHIPSWHWAGDDQRRTGIVNQDGVHLIHHGKMVLALNQVLCLAGHVVSEVVKAKLVVGAVHDIAGIGFFPSRGIGLVLIDAVYAEAVKLKQGGIPLGISLGEVVVDCHQVYTTSGECIEEGRERGYQRFTFTSTHFRDFSFVKDHAADQLHVVVHHVPDHLGTCCHPFVVPDSLVTLDLHIWLAGSELPVT